MAGGRPTKYREEYAGQVYKLCLLGATDEQIADFFGVVVQTVHNWADEHAEFLEARKNGKLAADASVAEALYHRALGYEHDAVKILAYEGVPIEVPYRKRYPPDTAAAFIWLKNRAGWRDKQEHHHSGRVDSGVLMVPAEGDDDWDAVAKRMQGQASGNGAGGNGNGRA